MAQGGTLDDPDSILKDAIKCYEADCEHPLNVKPDLHTPADVARYIEQQGANFANFRGRHESLWSGLKKVIDPISNNATLINSIIGAVPVAAPVAVVLSSVINLLGTGQRVSNAYDWIESVFKQLDEYSERFTVYCTDDLHPLLRKKMIAILAFMLRVMGRAERLIKKGRFRKYLEVTFIGTDSKTKALVTDLEQLLNGEERTVLALTYQRVHEVDSKTKEVREMSAQTFKVLGGVADDLQEVYKIAKDNAARQASHEQLENLRTTLYTDTAARVNRLQAEATREDFVLRGGKWLWEEPLYETWSEGKSPVLWVFGKPGSGKSTLAALLTKRLHDLCQTVPAAYGGTSVGTFFFKDDDANLRDPNIALKTLCWQIQEQDELFRSHAAHACELSGSVSTCHTTWTNLLLEYYEGPRVQQSRTFLIIDGLDEAQTDARRAMLRLFKGLEERSKVKRTGGIQIAVFGRQTLKADLEAIGHTADGRLIEVEPSKSADDLNNYIKNRLLIHKVVEHMLKRKPGGTVQAKKFLHRIGRKVLEGADGVFLWAKLFLDDLNDKDENEIEELVQRPPSKIWHMISKIFVRVHEEQVMNPDDTALLLAWLAYSKRPLKFGELDAILRLEKAAPNWLLWDRCFGIFSSIVNMQIPKGHREEASKIVAPESSASLGPSDKLDAIEGLADLDLKDEISPDGSDDNLEWDFDTDNDEDKSKPPNDAPNSCKIDNEPSGANDLNPDELYDMWQKNTTLELRHQRFREFLKGDSAYIRRAKALAPIYLELNKIEVILTLQCLKMLRLASTKGRNQTFYSLYPTLHIFSHLGNIKYEHVQQHEKLEIISGLHWYLHTDEGHQALFSAIARTDGSSLDALWHQWFHNPSALKTIQSWFGKAKDVFQDDHDRTTWMINASKSVKDLLHPLALSAAKIWLAKPSYDSEMYYDKSEFQICFLRGYLSMNADGQVSDELKDWNWARDGATIKLPVDEIKRLAEWAHLDKSTHWYASVGWVVWQAGYPKQAEDLLLKAVQLDNHAWPAMEALAHCYGDAFGKYDEAVKWMTRAIEVMPDNYKAGRLDSYLAPYVARWRRELGNDREALETAERAWNNSPENFVATREYLTALEAAKDWPAIMKVVQRLHDKKQSEIGYSYLVRWFDNDWYSRSIGLACRHLGAPQFMPDAIRDIVEVGCTRGDPRSQLRYLWGAAEFLHEYCDAYEDPIRYYEQALQMTLRNDASTIVKMAGGLGSSIKVAPLYFDLAVASRSTRPSAISNVGDVVEKLRKLALGGARYVQHNPERPDTLTPSYPSMLWGRWLRDYEHVETRKWKKVFRPRLIEHMLGLDDDDPNNDTDACLGLAFTLLHAGDERNAGAILAVLLGTRPLPGSAESNVSTLTSGGVLKLSLREQASRQKCDGCQRALIDTERHYACQICFNKCFCDECLQKVKNSQMEVRMCNANHEWYQFWPAQEAKINDDALSYVGGKALLRKSWLEELRRAWSRDD